MVGVAALIASAAFAAAAVLFALPTALFDAEVSKRLAWGTSVFGVPLLLREVRTILVSGRVRRFFVAAFVATVVGIVGVPLVTALFVVGWRLSVALRLRGGMESMPECSEATVVQPSKVPDRN